MAGGGVALEEPAPGDEEIPADAATKIKEEEVQIRRVQEWWSSEPNGPASAAAHSAVIGALERALVAEVIGAAGGWHTILTADRLDGLHRQYGSGSEPALDPLRKALQARGGSKAQARAVGMLLFKEARALLEGGRAAATAVPTPARSAAVAAAPQAHVGASPAPPPAAQEVRLDEVFVPPRRYVRSEAYPPGAIMAARAAPNPKGAIVATLPADFEYFATGRAGEFLEVQVEVNREMCKAYVPPLHQGRAMLVPAITLDETFTPAQRWVQAAGYPEGATMAVKAEPSWESKQITTLPPEFDQYVATGRAGDFLEVTLAIDGAAVRGYVLHRLRDMILLEPAVVASCPQEQPQLRCEQVDLQQQQMKAAEAVAAARAAADAAEKAAAAARAMSDVRVEALEARVSAQEQQIRALQADLNKLRASLSTAGIALAAAGGDLATAR